MPTTRTLSETLSLPILADGLEIRPVTHADNRVLAERLVAGHVRPPEGLGRGMRVMRDLVLRAGTLVVEARSTKDGTLVACDRDGDPRAYLNGRVHRAPGGGATASVHWDAAPGPGNEEATLSAARAVVSALLQAGCSKVSIAYDDEEAALGAQAEALGFEPDGDDPHGTTWSVTADRLRDDDAPPGP